METTYVSRERAITEINNMKNAGAVLYYFNGNTYTFEFEGRIHAVDTADGQGLNNWQIMDFDWSDRYIQNTLAIKLVPPLSNSHASLLARRQPACRWRLKIGLNLNKNFTS